MRWENERNIGLPGIENPGVKIKPENLVGGLVPLLEKLRKVNPQIARLLVNEEGREITGMAIAGTIVIVSLV